MKRLRETALAIGDIILTTTDAPVSKAIRIYTKSDISHAMLYVDHCSVVDATAESVQARNTQRIFFDDNCTVRVLRLKTPLCQSDLEAICNFVRSRVGTQYATREALRTALGGSDSWTRKQFCSRLVAQAYESVGQLLVPDPNFCSPEDLRSSPLLAEVNAVTQPISDHEVEQIENDPDMTQLMRDKINAVLEGARKKNKHIQDLNDIDQHLVKHPEDDGYFCDLFTSIGYLTLWRAEMDKNPWQYDIALLRSINWSDAKKEEYCRNVILTAASGGKRYHLNKGGYLKLWSEYKLRSFRLLSSLYEILSDLDMRRFHVAKEWLNASAAPTEIPNPYLMPHSPEWFAALKEWNPYQAEITSTVIKLAGKVDVCSICGDEPASVYKLNDGPPPLGSVATLRLCEDCLQIRAERGESFVLFKL